MATKTAQIKIKRSGTALAVPTSLAAGEPALNTTDKKLYSSDGTTVFQVAPSMTEHAAKLDAATGLSTADMTGGLVYATKFGVVGGTGTDQSADLKTAIQYVADNGGILVLPQDVYLASRVTITSTSKPFGILGGSIRVANSTGGIRIETTSIEHRVAIKGTIFHAGTATAGRPLEIIHPLPSPLSWRTCSVVLEDVTCTGWVFNSASYRFTGGISLTNCWHGVLRNVVVNGAENNNMTACADGIKVDGYSINMTVDSCYAANLAKGFDWGGEAEGGKFTRSNAVTCAYGIYASGTTPNPHLVVNGCHFNVTTRGVYANSWNAVQITSCLFYRLNTEVGYKHIELVGCDFAVVSNNSAHLGGGVENWFVYANNCNELRVTDNGLQGVWHHIELAGTSARCFARNNVADGTYAASEAVEMVDGASGSYNRLIHWREDQSNRVKVVATGSAAANSLATATTTAITWNATPVYNEQVGFSSGTPTVITAPAWAKNVRLSGRVEFASNSTGYRLAVLRKNGTAIARAGSAAATGCPTTVEIPEELFPCTSGDTFDIAATQNSGGALQVGAGLSMLQVEFLS